MKEYVVGDYYESPDQIETIENDKWRKILENLKDAYPYAKTVKRVWEDLKDDTGMAEGTIYTGINLLRRYHFIHELNIPQREEVIAKNRIEVPKKGTYYDAKFYIVEQSDSTLNLLSRHDDPKKRLPKYILAPGYVEYDEKFSRAWDVLLSKLLIKDNTLGELSKSILHLLDSVLSITAEDKETEEVVPSTGYSSEICTNCGINHEARNFLRAIMLKILDYIEISPDYRDLLERNKIISDLGSELYQEASEQNRQVLESLSEEKTLGRQGLKEEGEYHRKESPPGVVWMRIIATDTYKFRRTKETSFLAYSNDGSYISAVIPYRLIPKNMKAGTLIVQLNPLKYILMN